MAKIIGGNVIATLYDWNYAKAATESELCAFISSTRSKVKTNTLLELKLDPAVKLVTASRHF